MICLLLVACSAQDSFVGKLVYEVKLADTAMQKLTNPNKMIIYTNDTILRVESESVTMGKQVMIKHLIKHKAYLLVQSAKGDFAVQIKDTRSKDSISKYSFEKARGKKRICGLKSKKLLVSNPSIKQKFTFYYSPSFKAKYLPGYEDFPGLLSEYYSVSADGVYHYKLIEITPKTVSSDLFGIPSNYQIISMSDFVDLMTGSTD